MFCFSTQKLNLKSVVSTALLLFFTHANLGCKSSSDNPLLGDYQASESCPKGGCVDTATNASGLVLKMSSQDRYLEGQNKVEVTGVCSTANYSDNQIDVTVVDVSRNVINTGVQSMNINDSSLRCREGKFHFVIDASGFATNQPYKVSFALKGKINNVIQTSSGYATISFNVYRN